MFILSTREKISDLIVSMITVCFIWSKLQIEEGEMGGLGEEGKGKGWYRVGGAVTNSSSHTTVRAVRHTAVHDEHARR